MLTVDYVRARRKNRTLEIVPLTPGAEVQLLDIASSYILFFESSLYVRRDELEENCKTVYVPAYLQKPSEGILKLLNDRSEFSAPTDVDPVEIRACIFKISAEHRQRLHQNEQFDRNAVLLEAASQLNIDVFRIDECLFGDLKDAQRLMKFNTLTAQQLVKLYQSSQEQAILLKASELIVSLKCDDMSKYRYFFRQLKFHRLLYELTEIKEGIYQGGYEVKISGPHHLFKSVTKYGMQLALLLPALRICQKWKLNAKVLWGKEKDELDFFLSGEAESWDQSDPMLPEEGTHVVNQFKKLSAPWKVRRAHKIFNIPNIGICVPDLVFSHDETGEKVYMELMGYWSREAIFKRIDMVNAGLSEKIIFAYSERLRVNEALLEDHLHSSLLSYKGTISIKILLKKLDDLIDKSALLLPKEALGAMQFTEIKAVEDESQVEVGEINPLEEEI